MEDLEVWRLIPSLQGVMASSRGRLMVVPYLAAVPRGKGMRQYGGEPTNGQWDGARYVYVLRGKTYKVHRLVCEAFNGPPPNGAVCMHMDENSRNNLPGNLKWGTQKENLNAPKFLEYCRGRVGANSPVIKGQTKQEAA